MAMNRPPSGVILGACALLTLLACGPDEPAPPQPDDDDDATPIEGRFGLINLLETDLGLEIHALFSEQVPGLGPVDGLAWLGVVDPAHGYWRAPDVTDQLVSVDELEVELAWTDERFYDVGDAVVVAGISAPRVDDWADPDGFQDGQLVFYRSDVASALEFPDVPAGFAWEGGADVGAVEVLDAVGDVGDVALTSHDPAIPQMWYEGTDLDLGWDGDGAGEVWLTLLGDRGWLAARITEGDGYTLPSGELEAVVHDGFDVCVARTEAREVDAGTGTVVVRTTRQQRVSFERSGVLTVNPDVVHLDSTVELQVMHHDGAFVEGTTVFDLGEGIAVDVVEVPGGEGAAANLRVTVEPTAATGERDISATTGAETVVSERMITVYLPPTDTCEVAFALPQSGIYHGDLSGLADDYSDPSACTGYAAEGPDAVYSIEVADDEILSATMFYPDGDAVLYLASDCDSVELPVACSDSGGLNVAEFLSYAPSLGAGGTFYLIVDTYSALSDDATEGYSLYVERYAY